MEVYRQASSKESLLPTGQGSRLAELTCEILKASGRLSGQVHSPLVLQRVAEFDPGASANLQRASCLRQFILQKAFTGELATGVTPQLHKPKRT